MPPPASVRSQGHRPRAVVVGDLMLDVVLVPDGSLSVGTDVPGRVSLRQGGSAANTARWLARLGLHVQLVCAVGRDAAGRALVRSLRADAVAVRATRIAGNRTGRIGVLIGAGGERSFVADRGAADRLAPEHLRAGWFAHTDVVHLPAYSLLGDPLGRAGQEAVRRARASDAVLSLDLASAGPLLAIGRSAAVEIVRSAGPDILFATARELHALLGAGGHTDERARSLAPTVVVKRGSRGVTVLVRDGSPPRFDLATARLDARDTTGAGDAFDAGFLAGWLAARLAGHPAPLALRRAAISGHRAAVRELVSPRPEISFG